MERILLYGGAFNPPHKGHELLLKKAIEAIKPTLTVVTPSGVSPHKHNAETPFADRLNMASLAFKSCGKRVKVSGIERGGKHTKSYTFKTVRKLKKKYRGSEIFLLIGSDMLITFSEWHLYRRLLSEVTIVAASREDEAEGEVEAARERLEREGARVLILRFEPVEISSTEIRGLLAKKGSTDAFLSDGVSAYIRKRKLYI